MSSSPPPVRSLSELFTALQAAVKAGDHLRATQLHQEMMQRLATEAAEQEALEREVRALMATLPPTDAPLSLRGSDGQITLGDLFTTRSSDFSTPPLTVLSGLEQGICYPVWFGTNRRPTADGQGFSAERHTTTRGQVDVYVPQTHRFGETGSSFLKRLWRQRRFNPLDDHLRVEQVNTLERDAFFAAINRAMVAVKNSGEAPQALFYLHGYNTTFEEAAIRAAQIGCDLKIPGATAFFSWPSGGTVAAYPADEAAIEASERAITDFLVDFAASCGAEKVHVIAHSMGNRGLLRALQRIAGNAETRSTVKFGQIFLAAPDVDHDLFLDLADLYPTYSERTTLYASDQDLAVHISSRLHRAPRAGYFTPYTVAPGIDTIAVPGFDIDWLGHGYFAKAEALLHDIYSLMRFNQNPVQRLRIRMPNSTGNSYWELLK